MVPSRRSKLAAASPQLRWIKSKLMQSMANIKRLKRGKITENAEGTVAEKAEGKVAEETVEKSSTQDFIPNHLLRVKDPVAYLHEDVLFELFSFLSPAEIVQCRGVSKLWQTTLDLYATNAIFKHHYPTMGLAARGEDTREEANLRFRREVSHLESMKKGHARGMIYLSDTYAWHINGSWLVTGTQDGLVMLLEIAPGDKVKLQWKMQAVKELARPFGNNWQIPAVLTDVIVMTNGWVLVDSGPCGLQTTSGGRSVTASMFSESGELMWEVYPGEFAGKAFIKDDIIYRVEFGLESDGPPRDHFHSFFVARNVLDGAILFLAQLPSGFQWNGRFSKWSLTMLGFLDYALFKSCVVPFIEVIVVDLKTGRVLAQYRYHDLEWMVIWSAEPKFCLGFKTEILIDGASPKSPGFQTGYLEINTRLNSTYRPVNVVIARPDHLKLSQRFHWEDDAGKIYTREIFLQLHRGIVKLRIPEAQDSLTRSVWASLHCTESRQYYCLTTPTQKGKDSKKTEGEGERETFRLKLQNHRDEIGWLGMAGRFLVLYNFAEEELFVFDFRAPI